MKHRKEKNIPTQKSPLVILPPLPIKNQPPGESGTLITASVSIPILNENSLPPYAKKATPATINIIQY